STLRLFAEETLLRAPTGCRLGRLSPARKEKNDESGRFPPACSPSHDSRSRKVISGTSGVSGPVGAVGGRMPAVAGAESVKLGGVGSCCPCISRERRRSRLRHCLMPHLHPRMDDSRERSG